MNSIIKISLMLMVMSLISTLGAPTSTEPSPNQPAQDIRFDFFQKKAEGYTKNNTLLWASTHIKILQTYVAYLENQKQNSDDKFNSQTLKEARKALEQFTESFESWNKDKLNCYLLRDMLKHIFEFEKHTKDHRIDDELIKTWQKMKSETSIVQDRAAESLYTEINDQLPQIIEPFLQSLAEAEKKDYKYAFGWYQSKYSVFHAFYQKQLGFDDNAAADEDGCKNFESKTILSFLEMLMDMWSKRYPKAT